MKKEDIASFIVYILMLTIALLVGLLVIQPIFQSGTVFSGPAGMSYLWTFLIILGALLFNIIMLEVFHVLGGKAGKYNIVSFNVLGFCFYKAASKWKFAFRSFDGLTGETILSPKSEKSSPKAFVWFPLLGYLVELIVGIILYSIGSGKGNTDSGLKIVAITAIVFVAVSSMIALYNFVPLRLDSMTDGYRLTLISKPINVEAYNELMRIENLQREGKEIDNIKVFDEITEFTASLNLISVYDNLGKRNFYEAEKMIDKIIENPDKISNATRYRLLAQKLYIKILTLSLEEASKYYEENIPDEVRRFISNDLSMESVRAYVLIAGLLDESRGEVQYANSRKSKAMKRALTSRANIEEELYNDAINKVKEAHPDWDLSQPS